jgi:hypothetical protein
MPYPSSSREFMRTANPMSCVASSPFALPMAGTSAVDREDFSGHWAHLIVFIYLIDREEGLPRLDPWSSKRLLIVS